MDLIDQTCRAIDATRSTFSCIFHVWDAFCYYIGFSYC